MGIIGAGIAGIDLARFLARNGLRVVLLESGRMEFDSAIQALVRVSNAGKPLRTPETHSDITPYVPSMYRGYPRIRQFGGTTRLWTGKWRIPDPWELEARAWIPESGWPISLEELQPLYEEVARDYGLGDFKTESEGPAFQRVRRLLAPHRLIPHLFYWEATPTSAGTRFFQEVKRADRIDAILGATATEILLDDSLRQARAIRCRALDGRECMLEAACFVLAAGGLEVPRLLLASNRQVPQGVGNAHDLVGRYFMDHAKAKVNRLTPGPAMLDLLETVKSGPRPRFAVHISLSRDVQRDCSLPSHAVYMKPIFAGRSQKLDYLSAKLCFEQTPCRESRVYLEQERDALGMPRLAVDWRFNAADQGMLDVIQTQLTSAFTAAGLGSLDFDRNPLSIDQMLDGSHHMGTTRMAANPREGVVDADCRVFGTKNLFVASSSVFATAFAYSPTYTIVVLARRLGHRLLKVERDRHSVPRG